MTSNEFMAEQINKIWEERIRMWRTKIERFLALQSPMWIDYVNLLVTTKDEMTKAIQEVSK